MMRIISLWFVGVLAPKVRRRTRGTVLRTTQLEVRHQNRRHFEKEAGNINSLMPYIMHFCMELHWAGQNKVTNIKG